MKSLEKAVEPKAGEEMTEEAKRSYESLKKEEKELYSRRHFGLSAKELEKVYPNLVLKGQDGYQYINYTELVPILIRSIQELKAELDEVKSKDTEVKRARAASFEEDEDIDLKDATSIPAMVQLFASRFLKTHRMPSSISSICLVRCRSRYPWTARWRVSSLRDMSSVLVCTSTHWSLVARRLTPRE